MYFCDMGIEVNVKPKQLIDPDKLRNIDEYAAMIGKTNQRVWQMIKAKELKAVNIRGKDFVVLD